MVTSATTNGTSGTNVSTNGTIDYREAFRVLWLLMVPLATNGTIGKISNGTIGKISNGTIGRIPNAGNVWYFKSIHHRTCSPRYDCITFCVFHSNLQSASSFLLSSHIRRFPWGTPVQLDIPKHSISIMPKEKICVFLVTSPKKLG